MKVGGAESRQTKPVTSDFGGAIFRVQGAVDCAVFALNQRFKRGMLVNEIIEIRPFY